MQELYYTLCYSGIVTSSSTDRSVQWKASSTGKSNFSHSTVTWIKMREKNPVTKEFLGLTRWALDSQKEQS